VSDAGVTAILAELAVIREDMAALNKRMDALTAAHAACVAHCWVGNQAQLVAKLKGEG